MNTNAVSVIDVENLSLIGSMSMDEPDRGAGGIWDIACDGNYLVAAHSGTHEVSIVEYQPMIERLLAYGDYSKMDYDLYFMRNIRARLPLNGNGPRNISLKDGKLYVPTYFSDTLNVVDVASQKVDFVAYNPHRVESPADAGERAFNDAVLCYQNWQSCNGCHPGDGRTDGMNWDLMNDGIGNSKNCKSMLYSFETPKCMISGNAEVLERLERVLNDTIGDRLSVFRSEPYFLEVMPENLNKARAIELMLGHLGCSREELIACGDGFNDVCMIEYAGLGVAMANACEPVKAVADFVTKTNDEDGVAYVVEKFMLGVAE